MFPLVYAKPRRGLVEPWYLKGGVPLADCLAAYLAKGVVDAATSYTNLANVGTYTLTAGASGPSWGVAAGWTWSGGINEHLTQGDTGAILKPCTFIARVIVTDVVSARTFMSGSTATGPVAFKVHTDGKPKLEKGATSTIGYATTAITNGLDTVLAASYSAAGVWAHYTNGVDNGSGTTDTAIIVKTNRIGAASAGDFPMKGSIAAISIYNTVLTPAQVAAISAAMAAL